MRAQSLSKFEQAPGPEHHLTAFTVTGEDPSWLEALHEKLLAENEPADAIESHLVWRLTLAIWRSDRASRIEAAAWRRGEAPLRVDEALIYMDRQHSEVAEALRLLRISRLARAGDTRLGREQARSSGDPECQREADALDSVMAWLTRAVAATQSESPVKWQPDRPRSGWASELDSQVAANGNAPGPITVLHP